MWTFLEVFICGNNLCFQHGNHRSYFLLSFAGQIALYFAIHHCQLWVQKIRNHKFSDILKKLNVNFLLEVILFL